MLPQLPEQLQAAGALRRAHACDVVRGVPGALEVHRVVHVIAQLVGRGKRAIGRMHLAQRAGFAKVAAHARMLGILPRIGCRRLSQSVHRRCRHRHGDDAVGVERGDAEVDGLVRFKEALPPPRCGCQCRCRCRRCGSAPVCPTSRGCRPPCVAMGGQQATRLWRWGWMSILSQQRWMRCEWRKQWSDWRCVAPVHARAVVGCSR